MWPFFSVAKSTVAGPMIGERGEGGVSGQEGRLWSCEPPSHSRTTKYECEVPQWLVRTASILLIAVINGRNAYVTPAKACARACERS